MFSVFGPPPPAPRSEDSSYAYDYRDTQPPPPQRAKQASQEGLLSDSYSQASGDEKPSELPARRAGTAAPRRAASGTSQLSDSSDYGGERPPPLEPHSSPPTLPGVLKAVGAPVASAPADRSVKWSSDVAAA